MKVFKFAAAAVAVAGAFVSGGAAAQALVKVDGSSTVFPVTEAVAEEFQKAKKGGVRVTVGVSGTGGGFKKFCRGETDISNASRPISKKEIDDCKAAGIEFVELPIAFDALTVVLNPKNDWADKGITVAQLKAMWEPAAQGKITKWNQVNPAWPDRDLTLYGAGADSGTFDYFTEAVTGKSKSSRGDFTASEDDNVLVQGVSRDVNALGFFGFAYYEENKDKLKAAKIIAEDGKPAVGPSMESVLDGSYTPLSRPIFIYVNAKSLEKPEVKEFVEFYNKEGAALAAEVKYVPLPKKAYDYNIEQVAKLARGTKFGGENKVGITIEELMSLEAK
ncbi:PstS family phosphate ABC transporter substrate-binding protein [Thauera chlorobenzoica]|uniref:Phosphate-binding protein n=1 Tax=Thauera chlorobenzoica TaxID=96773 RepID=A0A1H5VJE3_9RHOO|nr:PstS family phosphate ABC transporter substrate-binding protein [Thauera chlorobenzoica]APR05760.1 Phosphate ABC transporter, periplasmic phosphate-binding protein PstS [Thauera chlorobenzoica]SEF87419.1 phosphate ABC transporter substrate-binding protein, PhoT family [Thauera chlorobenzoica]